MKGWVYVISNKAMPGLVKVGYSMKDPKLRAEELDTTGSPHPYTVEYEMHIGNPQGIEQQVHQTLSPYREGREWFRCSCKEAIDAIRKVAGKNVIYEVDRWSDPDKMQELPFEKWEINKSEAETEVLKLIEKGKACEARRDYWHAHFYYTEAEKKFFGHLATKFRLELEKKVGR